MDRDSDDIIREMTRTRVALDEKLVALEQRTRQYRPGVIFSQGRLILAATLGALAVAVRGVWRERRAAHRLAHRQLVA